MQETVDARNAVDHRLAEWRQGDLLLAADLPFVHLASGRVPLTEQANEVVSASPLENTGSAESDLLDVLTDVEGHVVLTQTCDIVRSCQERPFVQLAPLIAVDEPFLADVQRLRRPAFATVTVAAERGLVADLDRCMTVEKSVLARSRTRLTASPPGMNSRTSGPPWSTPREGLKARMPLSVPLKTCGRSITCKAIVSITRSCQDLAQSSQRPAAMISAATLDSDPTGWVLIRIELQCSPIQIWTGP